MQRCRTCPWFGWAGLRRQNFRGAPTGKLWVGTPSLPIDMTSSSKMPDLYLFINDINMQNNHNKSLWMQASAKWLVCPQLFLTAMAWTKCPSRGDGLPNSCSGPSQYRLPIHTSPRPLLPADTLLWSATSVEGTKAKCKPLPVVEQGSLTCTEPRFFSFLF